MGSGVRRHVNVHLNLSTVLWNILKAYLPQQIPTRDLKDHLACKRLLNMVKSLMFGQSAGVKLWSVLGHLTNQYQTL